MKTFLLVVSFFLQQPRNELHEHPTIKAMLKENNRIRASLMLSDHRISPALTKAAQDQAEYMAKTHDFEHITQNNGSPGVRAYRYGYSGTVRENLGRGYKSIDKVFLKWTQSESHMQSITGGFTEVGFGYSVSDNGVGYWVAIYGKPR